MPPDPGCYEERYRLTSRVALRLAGGLLSVGLGLVWRPSVISATSVILAIPVIFSALTVAFVMPAVITIARRMIAFRADYVGITLGVMPTSLAALHRPAIFIPWAEVEKIILYRAGSPGWGGNPPVRGISVQRRDGTASPVTGVAPTAACTITGWNLDRERLAAVTAAVAPSIPVIDPGGADVPSKLAALRSAPPGQRQRHVDTGRDTRAADERFIKDDAAGADVDAHRGRVTCPLTVSSATTRSRAMRWSDRPGEQPQHLQLTAGQRLDQARRRKSLI